MGMSEVIQRGREYEVERRAGRGGDDIVRGKNCESVGRAGKEIIVRDFLSKTEWDS